MSLLSTSSLDLYFIILHLVGYTQLFYIFYIFAL